MTVEYPLGKAFWLWEDNMCLAVPMQIKEINGDMGKVESGGVAMDVGISLLSDVKIGEWVIVHAGFAISKVNHEEAMETLALFEEMAALETSSKKSDESDTNSSTDSET